MYPLVTEINEQNNQFFYDQTLPKAILVTETDAVIS